MLAKISERIGGEVPPEERPEQRPSPIDRPTQSRMKWVATPMATARTDRERVSSAAMIRASRNRPVCANRCVPERIPLRRLASR